MSRPDTYSSSCPMSRPDTYSCVLLLTGWMITYNGKNPHVGSLTISSVGTKLIAQIIVPKEWAMNYV